MDMAEDFPPFVQQLVGNKVFKPKSIRITSIANKDQDDEYEYNLQWYEENEKAGRFPSSRSSSEVFASARSGKSSPHLTSFGRKSRSANSSVKTSFASFHSNNNSADFFNKSSDEDGVSAKPLKNILSTESLRLGQPRNELTVADKLSALKDWMVGVRVSDLSNAFASTPSLTSAVSSRDSTPRLTVNSVEKDVLPESPQPVKKMAMPKGSMSTSMDSIWPSTRSSPTPSFCTNTSSSNATRDSRWDRIVQDDAKIADDEDNASRCSSCVIL